MKAKKKLLIGTAIAALAAGGVSAVSTMAWYAAGPAATPAGSIGALSGTMGTSASTAVVENVYAKFVGTVNDTSIALTAANGNTYAVTSGKIANATASKYWGTITVAFDGWYEEAACTTKITNDGKLANIKSGYTLSVSANAGSRTRIVDKAHKPSGAQDVVTNVFADALKAQLTGFCTYTTAANGAVNLTSAEGTNIVYFSIAGAVTGAGTSSEAEASVSVGASASAEDGGSVSGSVTFTVEVAAPGA